jgi:CBS domain containing-hemolysin-like protein
MMTFFDDPHRALTWIGGALLILTVLAVVFCRLFPQATARIVERFERTLRMVALFVVAIIIAVLLTVAFAWLTTG